MDLDTIKRNLSPLRTQLGTGSGTEGSDCGCLGDINCIDWGSHKDVGPNVQTPASNPQSVASWVRILRRLANNPTGPMMVFGDVYQALAHPEMQAAFRRAGHPVLKVDYHYGIAFQEVRKFLSASPNHSVLLAIDYSVARADGCPTGSMSFGGGHIVWLVGAERRRTRTVRRGKVTYPQRWKSIVGDSLMDGRPQPGGGHYPKGWLITRLYKYRRAAGMFGTAPNGSPRPIGDNRAVAIFVTRND